MKTKNTAVASSSKSSKNTPVASFASYVAKVTDSKKANALKEVHAKEQAKKEQAKKEQAKKEQTKPQTKKGVFALVAGSIAKIEHKALKKAVAYHISKGNLVRMPEGIKLTAQGATLWNAERIAPNADTFQKIAAFVNGGPSLPEFGGDKKSPVKVGAKQLPSLEYWGGFVTTNMRLCFAALWASK